MPARAIRRSTCRSGSHAATTTAANSRSRPVSYSSGISAMANGVAGSSDRVPLVDRAPHHRVDDGLQVAPGAVVGEDDGAERRPVHLPIGVQHAGAEAGRPPPPGPVCPGRSRRAPARPRRWWARPGPRTGRARSSCPWRCRRSARRAQHRSARQVGAASPTSARPRAGAMRSSMNVFQSWHCGHCHSSSVLR